MAETYSLAAVTLTPNPAVGVPADNPLAAVSVKIGDSVARYPGAQQLAMQQNTRVLCKGPDGGLRWYTIDPSRSIGGNPVLIAVGP